LIIHRWHEKHGALVRSGIASGTTSSSQATPAFSISGDAANQKDGLERKAGRVRI